MKRAKKRASGRSASLHDPDILLSLRQRRNGLWYASAGYSGDLFTSRSTSPLEALRELWRDLKELGADPAVVATVEHRMKQSGEEIVMFAEGISK